MRGAIKPMDEGLAEWSSRAEREVKRWLRNSKYEVSELPHGKGGVDCLAENEIERFYVEVERTQPERWKEGGFPFATVNVLERRARYDHTVLLFTVRYDISRCVVVFPQSLKDDRLKRQPNIYMPNGDEFVFKVPIDEVLSVAMEPLSDPIAVLNARRVRENYQKAAGMATKRLALGMDEPPYGMSADEWKELHLKAEENERLRPCLHHMPEFWKYTGERDGRGCEVIACNKCGKFIGYAARH